MTDKVPFCNGGGLRLGWPQRGLEPEFIGLSRSSYDTVAQASGAITGRSDWACTTTERILKMKMDTTSKKCARTLFPVVLMLVFSCATATAATPLTACQGRFLLS